MDGADARRDPARERDPESRFENAGIPDLQDGTPEQQRAEDPQELPLPGDRPGASADWGTTAHEQRDGEPLDRRLERERPDPATQPTGRGSAAGSGASRADGSAGTAGVGRLVNEQGVEPGDTEVDAYAADVGADTGGLSPEERAMHREPD